MWDIWNLYIPSPIYLRWTLQSVLSTIVFCQFLHLENKTPSFFFFSLWWVFSLITSFSRGGLVLTPFISCSERKPWNSYSFPTRQVEVYLLLKRWLDFLCKTPDRQLQTQHRAKQKLLSRCALPLCTDSLAPLGNLLGASWFQSLSKRDQSLVLLSRSGVCLAWQAQTSKAWSLIQKIGKHWGPTV